MKICKICHTQNDDDVMFCAKCGSFLISHDKQQDSIKARRLRLFDLRGVFSKINVPPQKRRILLYGGLSLLSFLVGLVIPSPFFNRSFKSILATNEIELVDTVDMRVSDGIYSGSIIKDTKERHGFGHFESSDGSIYEGEWENDLLPYGTRTTSMSVYTGRFDRDLNNEGFGIAQYSKKYIDGKQKQGLSDSEITVTYLGNWSKNVKQGLGRSIKRDGSMEFGKYLNGLFQPVDGANYRVGGSVYGFDASHYQKDIDWDNLALFCDKNGNVYNGKVANKEFMQPVFFVYLKATEGATVKDDMYPIRMIEADRHGLVKGAYHFLHLGSDINSQLKNFFETVTWQQGDLPPALDVEIESEIEQYGAEKLQAMALEWLEKVEKQLGVKPVIYTRENIRNQYLNTSDFSQYKFWIARYSNNGPDNFDWQIWQRTETAEMKGHNGNVDVNLFRGDYNAFKQYLGQ